MAKGSGTTRYTNGNSRENTSAMYDHLSGTYADNVLGKAESISLIMENNNVDYDKAEEYYKALQEYTEDNVADTKTLEAFIKSAPKWYGDETYRSMDVSEDVLKQFKEGATYKPGRISSWSTDKYVSVDTFSGQGGNPVLLVCSTQPKGTSVVHASAYPEDAEVLVSKSVSYRITSVDRSNGKTTVYLEPKIK